MTRENDALPHVIFTVDETAPAGDVVGALAALLISLDKTDTPCPLSKQGEEPDGDVRSPARADSEG